MSSTLELAESLGSIMLLCSIISKWYYNYLISLFFGGVDMFCFSCGQELPDNAAFCFKCGANLSTLSSNNPTFQPQQRTSPLVPAKCTNCGGVLDINPASEAAICPFCNSSFIVQQAIQNYNLNIQSSTINIANANIQTGPSVDNLLARATDYIAKHDLEAARSYYEQVLDYDIGNTQARTALDILDNYVFTAYRINMVFVAGQQLLGHQYIMSVFCSKFLIEHIFENNVRKTTVIPFDDISTINKIPIGQKPKGIIIKSLSGKDVKMFITAENGRSTVDAIDEIVDFFDNTYLPEELPDRRALAEEGKELVPSFRNGKPPLLAPWKPQLFDATYKYMQHVHVPFSVAYPIVEKIAFPNK